MSDFGLTKEVHGKDYYQEEDKSISLPIRWMSIESIECSIFTTQTNVVCMTQAAVQYSLLNLLMYLHIPYLSSVSYTSKGILIFNILIFKAV